jgi:hypothetical protein
VKELGGKRRRGGIFAGVDITGAPSDPAHPWNAGGRSIIHAEGERVRLGAFARSKLRSR